jgi:hypothetical protein
MSAFFQELQIVSSPPQSMLRRQQRRMAACCRRNRGNYFNLLTEKSVHPFIMTLP